MTQVISTHVSRHVGNRLGFKHKSPKGLLDDVKAACARLGRMDIYHAVVAAHPGVRRLTSLRGMSLGAASGTFPLEKFEHYVGRLKHRDWVEHLDQRNNYRYEYQAQRSGRSTVVSTSSRAKRADRELALPDLFPDDAAPGPGDR